MKTMASLVVLFLCGSAISLIGLVVIASQFGLREALIYNADGTVAGLETVIVYPYAMTGITITIAGLSTMIVAFAVTLFHYWKPEPERDKRK